MKSLIATHDSESIFEESQFAGNFKGAREIEPDELIDIIFIRVYSDEAAHEFLRRASLGKLWVGEVVREWKLDVGTQAPQAIERSRDGK